jgi:hypothetical protein
MMHFQFIRIAIAKKYINAATVLVAGMRLV